MEFAKTHFIFALIFVAIPIIQAYYTFEPFENTTVDPAEQEKWHERKLAEAYNASLQAYHHDPYEVINELNHHVHRAMKEVNNSSRRGLKQKYKGECMATNPIDQCFRCKEDWAKDRKRLTQCVMGFGRRTTGGLHGEYYVVTDSSDDNVVDPKVGTLRFGVLQPVPLWIYFKTKMKITLQRELIVTSDKTIDGRGAQVEITGVGGITIQYANNIIIHNLKIYDVQQGPGGLIRDTWDHFGRRDRDDGDAVSVFASTNIWVDHLSMWNCKDGLIDILQGSTAVTISNNHFTRHDHVMLFGAHDDDPKDEIMQVTLAFNHFGQGLVQRMPRCRYGFFHVVNNDYTHWKMYAIGGTSHPTIISQGNRYIAPDDPDAKSVTSRNNNATMNDDWKHWIWRSEEDYFLNGAVFTESGQPVDNSRFGEDFIKAQPGTVTNVLTQFSGQRHCIPRKKC